METKIRILYADERANDRKVTLDTIHRAYGKFEVFEAQSVEEYEILLSKESPDILLCNLEIFGYSGVDFVRYVRDTHPDLPIIVVTSSGSEELAVRAMKMKVSDYIVLSGEGPGNLVRSIISVIENKKKDKEQRLIEDRIRADAIKYKVLTENAPVGIFSTDQNSNTNYVNPRWCEIARMNFDQAIGNGWLEKVHPDDRIPLNRKWQEDVVSGKSSLAEYRFLHEDGSITWVSGLAAPQIDENGNLQGYIGTILDITDHKKAEDKIIESEVYFRTLIDISPEGIITCDLDGKTTYGSRRAYEIFDEPFNADSLNKPVLNWVHPEYHQIILERFTGIIAGSKKPATGEFKLLKHDRTPFWAEMSSCPITDAKGKVTGLLIVCKDITERKTASAELLRAKEKAEESDRLKTAFLHNISHEIRTPLNAITGFSALLAEPDQTDETRKAFIDNIIRSSNHLLAIVNDIIEISNIEAGILKLNKNKVNLNALLNNFCKQFRAETSKKGLLFTFSDSLPEERADVITDRAKLTEILSNLISNAIKFTDKGKIEIGYSLKDKNLEFYVSDTGIGIAEDHHDKVFDRFFQLDNSTSRIYEGTGLGLSISKGFVEFLGGKIWLKSIPGEGTTFYFTIPYTAGSKPEKAEKKDIKGETTITSKGKKSILVVEDEENNSLLISKFLSKTGMNVIHAVNGREAVEICSSGQKVDIVFMDIRMPEMDGYTATRQIIRMFPTIPVIIQSAFEIDKARALKSGCSEFISKPFTQEELLAIIRKHLPGN